MEEKVDFIYLSEVPDVRIRIIKDTDTEPTIQSKIKYPFELFNTITVTVKTNIRLFEFDVYNGYTWNGADIPRFLWRIVGSRTDNQFLVASMIHDYLLQFKKYMIKEVLEDKITIDEYRYLTSIIFREKLYKSGVSTVKANIMSWCVDVFQHYFNRKQWKVK